MISPSLTTFQEKTNLLIDLEKKLRGSIIFCQQEIQTLGQSYCSEEILNQIQGLKSKLAQDKEALKGVSALLKFSPGEWVQNGSPTPGKIIDLRLDQNRPVVEVLWWQQEKTSLYSPLNLKKISDRDMAYQWYEKKLIRPCDRHECEDINIIKQKQAETEEYLRRAISFGQAVQLRMDYEQEIAYCKKRVIWLETRHLPQKEESSPKTIFQNDLFAPPPPSFDLKNLLSLATETVLSLGLLERNPSCQQREGLNEEVVEEYAEAMLGGATFPPVKAIKEGSKYWLFDGFHTTEAAYRAKLKDLRVMVVPGTFRDAILASVAVNAEHGLRRTNQTKRNAVLTVLADSEWQLAWSDRYIAKLCKVSPPFVSKLRKELEGGSAREDKKIATGNGEYKLVGKPDKEERLYQDRYGNISSMQVQRAVREVLSPDKTSGEAAPEVRKSVSHGQLAHLSAIRFELGSLIELKLTNFVDAPDNLKALNHYYGRIERRAGIGNSYYVKFFETGESYLVLAEDLREVVGVEVSVSFSATEVLPLLERYKNKEGIAIAFKQCALAS